MSTKDELYDPTVNCDSDSDSELNNARDKTPSSSSSPPTSNCFKDAFIHNHLERKGGPQSDRGGAAAGATGGGGKKCRGKKCLKETAKRWDGNRYSCSTNKQPNAKEWLKKHKFCWPCATQEKCPVDKSPSLPPNYPGHTSPNEVD